MGYGVTNISLSRAGLPVVEGLSFALTPGQALFLRGPNGSGKSTVLRALAGLGRIDAGEITLPEARAYTGHLDAIKPQLTVAENMRFWAALYGTTLTDAPFETAALTALSDRPAGTLSAGQKRRLGLARLLVTGADLWLMDEPTTALDTENAERISAIIKAHLSKGGMAIIATHLDMGLEAEALMLTDFAPKGGVQDSFLEGFA